MCSRGSREFVILNHVVCDKPYEVEIKIMTDL